MFLIIAYTECFDHFMFGYIPELFYILGLKPSLYFHTA